METMANETEVLEWPQLRELLVKLGHFDLTLI
jgi:hypothetical protein